jgi:FtsP/CotA-like multicopper oxidase with cupredoxin domain
MRKRRISQLVVLVAAAGLAGGVTPASPAPKTIDLCATTGSVTVPGNLVIPVWGFVASDCSVGGTASLPGPKLVVDEGDTVTLNVHNGLPGRTLSFEIPGIGFDQGAADVPPGAMVTRTFTAGAPGTYLYQSAGDGERQTAMGLYGALIVRSATSGQAYGTAASAYDVEAPLVLSAIDPAFNNAPDSFDMRDYRATYWLINGSAFTDPDTDPNIIHAGAGERVLLRYVNAGHDNSTMVLLGMDEHVIARDAHLLPNAFDAHAETIPAGATEDVIATVPGASSGLTHGFPLYNRQLHLGNGEPPGAAPGGMMTFIQSP